MQQPYRLGALLLQKNIINQQQLDAALQQQMQNSGLQLGQVLIGQGVVNQGQISRALHKQSRIRLYATCIAFLMAPFQVCNAGNEIESLPEYSYTQIADHQYGHDDVNDFSVEQNAISLGMLEVTTAAAWYLYRGGMANNEFNEVPVRVKLASISKDSYTVNVSISF